MKKFFIIIIITFHTLTYIYADKPGFAEKWKQKIHDFKSRGHFEGPDLLDPLKVIEYEPIRYSTYPNDVLISASLPDTEIIENKNPVEVYACPAEKFMDNMLFYSKPYAYKLYKFCLIKTKFKPNEPKQCNTKIKPVLEPTRKKLDHKYYRDSCGPQDTARFFSFGYLYCFDVEIWRAFFKTHKKKDEYSEQPAQDLPVMEIYGICYDQDNHKTLYTRHTITPKLFNGLNQQTDNAYVPEQLSVDPLRLNKELYFLRIKEAFENQENDVKYYMNAEMLVPPEDMPFSAWKTPSYHYINIAPLWEKLDPLMDLINDRIRQLAIKKNRKFTIYTIAFKTELQEYKTDLFLDQANDFPIPNIWIKLVHHQETKSAIAIVIHNTPDHPPKLKELCEQEAQCDFGEWVKQLQSPSNLTEQQIYLIKYGYCCAVTEKIMNFYHIKRSWIDFRNPFDDIDSF